MRRAHRLFFLPLILFLSGEALASEVCAETVRELELMLGAQAFPLNWAETTMDDGKPLVMSVSENNGSLFLKFIKTGEGLWAESTGVICKTGTDIEARFSRDQIRLGPAANRFLRYAFKNGGKFTLTKLAPDRLRVATSSWSGIFSPATK